MSLVIEKPAVNNSVVQNDKQKSMAKKQTPPTPAKLLKDMEEKRKVWESTVYRTSNQQLYALLAECYVFGGDLSFEEAKERSKDLAQFCEQRGYVVKKETPLMTRIVKAVFGNVDRRRISTYSLVLRSAKAENIQPDKLADWIEERGGVQEIKLSRSATYISPKAKAEKAQKVLSAAEDLAVAKSASLTKLADADFMGDECVLIAVQNSNGSFGIKALTRSSTALNAALLAVYGQQNSDH